MLRSLFTVSCIAALSLGCSVITDFSGVADGDGTSGSSGNGGGGTGASSGNGPPFPRLALYETGNPKAFEEPAHVQDAARVNLNVMGIYPGWEDTHAPLAEVLANVKQINPDTLMFVTVVPDQYLDSSSGDAYQEVIDKANAMSWWLYESGTSGTKVASPGSSNRFMTNLTTFTADDGDGLNFIEWVASFHDRTYFQPAPDLDGLVFDDLDWEPLVSGDYDLDGTIDPQTSTEVGQWYRAGARAYLDEIEKLAPERMRLARLHLDPGAQLTELEGALHGGIVPQLIGQTYSKENEGWDVMLGFYRRALEVTIDPKLVIFEMGEDATDYQTFRYGFATCLLDDGYFAFDDGDSYGLVWFDEYDAELGYPTTQPPTSAWSNGVWRRDFDKGIALVNPKGNGAQTLDLGGSFVHVDGTQDPVNDGTTTTSATLADRDGLILLRAP